jgi:CheY-like chemotaxis protein
MSTRTETPTPGTPPVASNVATRRVLLAAEPTPAWTAMASAWQAEGIECTWLARSAPPASALADAGRDPTVLVVDLAADPVRGMTLVTTCRHEAESVPVVVVASNPSIELARRIRLSGVFYLALDPVSPDEMQTVLSNAFDCLARKAPAARPYQTKRRVLIVDDDADFIASTASVLESEGYSVAVARSGKEGLEAVRAMPPDLVILDVMMEYDSAGYAVNQALKYGEGFECFRHIPVLMVSSITVDPSTMFRMAGEVDMVTPNGYLTKPLDIPAFLREVRALVGEGSTSLQTQDV